MRLVGLCLLSLTLAASELRLAEDMRGDDTHADVRHAVSAIISRFRQRLPLTFLADEVTISPFGSILLATLSSPRVILSLARFNQRSSAFYVLLPSNGESYARVLQDLIGDSRYLAIWLQPKLRFSQVHSMFEDFWQHLSIDVIAVVELRYGGVNVYTYYPFTPTRCAQSGPPVLIDTWHAQTAGFERNASLFDRTRKVYDLYGCPLRCSGTDRPPESIIRRGKDGSYILRGIGGLIFNFMTRHLNFTATIVKVSDSTTSYEGAYSNETSIISRDIALQNTDLGFGKYSILLDMHSDVEFTTEISMDCYSWAVPLKAGLAPSIWSIYLDEFSLATWLLTASSLVVAAVVLRQLSTAARRDTQFASYPSAMFLLYATMLGMAIKQKPRVTLLRFFLAQWLLYCLVVTAAYQCSLGSLITVPRQVADITDTAELLRTKLSITGGPQMFYILNASIGTSDHIRQLLKRFEVLPPGAFLPIIERVILRRDIAVFATKRLFLYSMNQLTPQVLSNASTGLFILPQCLIKSPSSPFIVRRGSPFSAPLNNALRRLFEAGIIKHWDREHKLLELNKQDFNKQATIVPFNLQELQGAVIVLAAGLTAAVAVFVFELAQHIWRTRFHPLPPPAVNHANIKRFIH